MGRWEFGVKRAGHRSSKQDMKFVLMGKAIMREGQNAESIQLRQFETVKRRIIPS